MVEEGSLVLPVVAALLLIGGWFAETQLVGRWRADWYFLAGLPLGARLVPIPEAPEGEGRTHSVCWEVSGPELVRYWVDPSSRNAPSGLHGVVVLLRTRHGVELDVRWAPPWTPILAAAWLAGLGILRGEAQLTVPIASCMVLGLFVVYGARARRVAAELRWSFVRGEPPEDEPG
jgi:hypothetical protein